MISSVLKNKKVPLLFNTHFLIHINISPKYKINAIFCSFHNMQ